MGAYSLQAMLTLAYIVLMSHFCVWLSAFGTPAKHKRPGGGGGEAFFKTYVVKLSLKPTSMELPVRNYETQGPTSLP